MLYKIHPFNTSEFCMNDYTREMFNEAFGIVPGRLTKPAVKRSNLIKQ